MGSHKVEDSKSSLIVVQVGPDATVKVEADGAAWSELAAYAVEVTSGHCAEPTRSACTSSDVDQQIMLASCGLLGDQGRAFFILPDAFLLKPGSDVRALLMKRGFRIWSIISLPARGTRSRLSQGT